MKFAVTLTVLGSMGALALLGFKSHAAHTHIENRAMQAGSCYHFLDSIGIVTETRNRHIDDFYDRILLPDLEQLGIRHIRVSIPPGPNDRHVQDLRTLADHGIHCIVTTKLPHQNTTEAMSDPEKSESDRVVDVVKALGSAVEGVEYPNEYWNHNSDPDWAHKLYDQSRQIHDALKSDPQTQNIPTIGPTFPRPDRLNGSNVNIFNGISDIGNIHMYDYPFRSDRNPYWKPVHDLHRDVYGSPSGMIMTETGFSTSTDKTTSVSEKAKCELLPRQLFKYLLQGYKRVYIYNFIDNRYDPAAEHANFGLVDFYGKAKPSFYAIKNMFEIFKDSSPHFQPGTLDFSLDGDTSDVKSFLLEKSNGDFYLTLWTEDDPDRNPTEQPVTITFNRPMAATESFYPARSAGGFGRRQNVNSISLRVSDSPLIVKLTPAQ